jgi:hypothetical protein
MLARITNNPARVPVKLPINISMTYSGIYSYLVRNQLIVGENICQ